MLSPDSKVENIHNGNKPEMHISTCYFLTKQYLKLLRTFAFLKMNNMTTEPVLYLLKENVRKRKREV